MAYRSAQSSPDFVRIPYSQNENDGGHLELCADVCATCGMTVVEPPFEGSDYFDMLMRQGLTRRAVRRRRPS